jgi:hypothetical protein
MIEEKASKFAMFELYLATAERESLIAVRKQTHGCSATLDT